MSNNVVIGLDLGSHHASIAIWDEEKDRIEVIADDLGSRTIPTVVAFRGDEILIGQAASSQEHKNVSNTFPDVLSKMMFSGETPKISIPALDGREIEVTDLGKHFFRNIHNQVKQQVGRVVRECVLSVPSTMTDEDKARIKAVAQEGGLRIKAMIPENHATLMAYGMDEPNTSATVCVLDMGWSATKMAVYEIRGGVFFPRGESTTEVASGAALVDALTKHCTKDFLRRTKNDCSDSKKAMTRLRKECESALKQLSIGQEVNIVIDSLFDGVDYSGRLSRARADDLCSLVFMQLRKAVDDFLQRTGINKAEVTQVCFSGGLSAVPKCGSTVMGLFPRAKAAKPTRGPNASGMTTNAEAQCAGAAMRGRELCLEGKLDKWEEPSGGTAGPLQSITKTLALRAENRDGSVDVVDMLVSGTPVPCMKSVVAAAVTEHSVFTVVSRSGGDAAPDGDDASPLAQVAFATAGATASTPVGFRVEVGVDGRGEITVDVKRTNGELIESVTIPVSN